MKKTIGDIKVLIAEAKDAEILGKIGYQSSLIHYQSIKNEFTKPDLKSSVSYMEESIDNKDIIVVKAEIENKIVGCMVVYINHYPEKYFKFPKRGFIGSIEVDENYRGCGVGKAMLVFVEELLKADGISILEIDVYTFNKRAEKLYDSLGFEDIKHYKRKFIG